MPEQLVFEPSLVFAQKLDQEDPLKEMRAQFAIPQTENNEPVIYFCGNSLGCMPLKAREYVQEELDQWQHEGVEGHFKGKHPWVNYHELFSEPLARLVCAKPSEVVAMNTLTVNLHLLMMSFYRPEGKRTKVLVEADAFPSDLYAVDSHVNLRGYDAAANVVKLAPRPGEFALRTDDILQTIEDLGDTLALVMLGGVNYYTGQVFEMKKITRAAKTAGAMVGWDLAHAIGNVPLYLNEWGVDFAVWCSYKYLNGGPGAVAGCFIHENHSSYTHTPRLAGWWGNEKTTRFQMAGTFTPIPTAEGWQMSNPPILALAPLRASLELFETAGILPLRRKSERLTGFARTLLAELEAEGAFQIITPAQPAASGCQLSLLTGSNGKNLFKYLESHGVICDWREPNVIRIAPVPLYNTFEEVWRFAVLLREGWHRVR
jgi:kynureninase